MPTYTIQTRAICNDFSNITKLLKENNYEFIEKQHIKDTYFSSPENINPDLHTYEKIGEDFRIRLINDDNLIAQQHIDSLKAERKSPSHDIYLSADYFKGNKKDYDKAFKIAREKGFTHKLIEISKNREIYQKDDIKIFIDEIDLGIFVVEVNSETENEKDYSKIKSAHIEILKNIGVSQEKIISDGYTHRKITQHIKSDPQIRKEILNEELQKTIKELKQKEKASGEAFTDTGDGWHENPTYETIWNDILILNNKIIQIKKELIDLNQRDK